MKFTRLFCFFFNTFFTTSDFSGNVGIISLLNSELQCFSRKTSQLCQLSLILTLSHKPRTSAKLFETLWIKTSGIKNETMSCSSSSSGHNTWPLKCDALKASQKRTQSCTASAAYIFLLLYYYSLTGLNMFFFMCCEVMLEEFQKWKFHSLLIRIYSNELARIARKNLWRNDHQKVNLWSCSHLHHWKRKITATSNESKSNLYLAQN